MGTNGGWHTGPSSSRLCLPPHLLLLWPGLCTKVAVYRGRWQLTPALSHLSKEQWRLHQLACHLVRLIEACGFRKDGDLCSIKSPFDDVIEGCMAGMTPLTESTMESIHAAVLHVHHCSAVTTLM